MVDQIHPCFSCGLPDCDETNPQCGLRKALNKYDAYRRRGEKAPDDVRRANSIAWGELYGATRAERRRAQRKSGDRP